MSAPEPDVERLLATVLTEMTSRVDDDTAPNEGAAGELHRLLEKRGYRIVRAVPAPAAALTVESLLNEYLNQHEAWQAGVPEALRAFTAWLQPRLARAPQGEQR